MDCTVFATACWWFLNLFAYHLLPRFAVFQLKNRLPLATKNRLMLAILVLSLKPIIDFLLVTSLLSFMKTMTSVACLCKLPVYIEASIMHAVFLCFLDLFVSEGL